MCDDGYDVVFKIDKDAGIMKTLRWVQETNMPLFCIAGGFIILFCLLSLWDMSLLGAWVEAGFALAVQYCGAFWQWEVLLTFCIAMGLCCHPGSRSILGNLKKPEFSAFQWGSMIMCTLLAGGGVFWAAGEPVWHFLNPPPYFDAIGVNDAASIALAQSFLHWGFLAWAILGALSTILLMYYHYEKGLPLAPRTLLYPVFGQYALEGILGVVIDASAIIAVVAGTVGPIGFLGLQVGYGLESLLGWTNTINHQSLIIVGLVMLYTISSVTGLKRGIQWLSRANMVLALLLLLFVMIAGPTWFIIKHFISGMLTYLGHLIPMSLYRHEASVFADINQLPWLSSWTLFFWGWFMGYGPMMAMFIARISRGRSIRSVIVMLAIIAPLVTHMWYTIIGGTGIAMELNHPGSIAGAIDGFNLPASLLAIVQQLPLGG